VASRAEPVAYDIDALTTAGRYRVTCRVRHTGGETAHTFFVKVVQSWGRSPAFRFVPEHFREAALASLPFEAEPRVYRSDLADRLPPGLAIPCAHVVVDLDAESTALWLDDIPTVPVRWDRAGLARAAHLLGRLAASPRVRPRATVADPRAAPQPAHLHRAPGRPPGRPRPARHRDLAAPGRRPRVRRSPAPQSRRRGRRAAGRR
jgi:hypothetical protein